MKTKGGEGFNSEFCTKPKCRTALDGGAGNQFTDENGKEQRYCWKHWQEYNKDLKRFPNDKEGS